MQIENTIDSKLLSIFFFLFLFVFNLFELELLFLCPASSRFNKTQPLKPNCESNLMNFNCSYFIINISVLCFISKSLMFLCYLFGKWNFAALELTMAFPTFGRLFTKEFFKRLCEHPKFGRLFTKGFFKRLCEHFIV